MLSPATPGEYAVEAQNASKSYGPIKALRELTVQVPHGSVFGLVGAEGAGKSTCLRAFAGLELLDAGEVRVAGIELCRYRASARQHVGYMPQVFGTYGDFTVYEYLEFYGAASGIRWHARPQLYRDLLELVDLLSERDSQVDGLKAGAQQRLALARCLIHDPEVLLLDEPMKDMAAWESDNLRVIVTELSGLNKTVIVTTERIEEVGPFCDLVGVLEDGQLTEQHTLEPHPKPHPNARLELRLLNARDVDLALRILRDTSNSSDARIDGERNVSAAFSGSEEDAPTVLETMRQAGVWITGFVLKAAVPETSLASQTPDGSLSPEPGESESTS